MSKHNAILKLPTRARPYLVLKPAVLGVMMPFIFGTESMIPLGDLQHRCIQASTMSWLDKHRKVLANTDSESSQTARKACARVPEMVGVSVADLLVEIGARQAAPHLLGGNEARAVEARHLRWQRPCSQSGRPQAQSAPFGSMRASGRERAFSSRLRQPAVPRRQSGAVRGVAVTDSHGIGSGRHGEDGRKGSTA